jgi:hypothetical protein
VPFANLDLLVVSNTQEVHEQLEEFFTELRKTHAAKAETVQTNETGVLRVVYPLRLPRAVQTKVTRDKDNKSEETTTEGETRFTMQELIALVTKTIEPASWNDEKVSIAALGDTLIVTHTQATQRKVQVFLSELHVLSGQQNNSSTRGMSGLIGGAASCGGPDGAREGGFF